jgi:hypothetical protein
MDDFFPALLLHGREEEGAAGRRQFGVALHQLASITCPSSGVHAVNIASFGWTGTLTEQPLHGDKHIL